MVLRVQDLTQIVGLYESTSSQETRSLDYLNSDKNSKVERKEQRCLHGNIFAQGRRKSEPITQDFSTTLLKLQETCEYNLR